MISNLRRVEKREPENKVTREELQIKQEGSFEILPGKQDFSFEKSFEKERRNEAIEATREEKIDVRNDISIRE